MKTRKFLVVLQKSKIEISIALLLFIFSFCFFNAYTIPFETTSDEVLLQYSAEKLLETGNANIFNKLNYKYDTYLFASYLTAFDEYGNAYLANYSGTIIFYSAALLIFSENVFLILNNLLAGFCVILVYLICLQLFKANYLAILGAVLVLTMPVFIKLSVDFLATIPFLFFFLFSVYFLLTDYKKKYFVSGIFFTAAFFVRLPDSLFIIPLLVLMYFKSAKKQDYIDFLKPVIVGIILIFIFNQILFGNFLFFPFTHRVDYPGIGNVNGTNYLDTTTTGIVDYLFYSEDFFRGIFFHMLFFLNSSFAFLFLPFAVVGLAIAIKEKKDFGLFSLSIFLIILFFYGHRIDNYHAFGVQTLNNPFVRYALPFFVLLAICFVFLLKKMFLTVGKSKKYMVPLFVIYLLTTITFTINYEQYGLKNYNKQSLELKQVQDMILTNTKSADIIITGYYTDKLVYPNRENVIAYSRTFSNIKITPQLIYDKLNELLPKIMKDQEKIFFVAQKNSTDDEYMKKFLEKRYKVTKVDEYYDIILFSITKKD